MVATMKMTGGTMPKKVSYHAKKGYFFSRIALCTRCLYLWSHCVKPITQRRRRFQASLCLTASSV